MNINIFPHSALKCIPHERRRGRPLGTCIRTVEEEMKLAAGMREFRRKAHFRALGIQLDSAVTCPLISQDISFGRNLPSAWHENYENVLDNSNLIASIYLYIFIWENTKSAPDDFAFG